MSILPAADVLDDLILFGFAAEPADHVDRHRKPGEPLGQRLLVLKRQHGGRREKRDLLPVHHRLERGPHRHFGLAIADVAAQQAIHRRRRFHVALDVVDGVLLVDREIPLEGVVELALPVRIRAERVARHGLARGVELEQLLGHVAHGLLDARLGAFPGGAAELVERRLRGAAVLLDEVEPLDRNEQLVFAEIAQLHEFLHGVADADLFEPDEPADAVIDVHDQVLDFEVAQIREERLGDRAVPVSLALDLGALFLEDVGLGNNLQLGARQPESFRQLPDGDVHGDVQQLVGAIDEDAAETVLGEQLGGTLGPPFGAGDEQHGVAALAHALDLGDPFLDAAAEFDGGLTRRCPGAWVRSRAVPCGGRRIANRQLIQTRGIREPLGDFGPRNQQLIGAGASGFSAFALRSSRASARRACGLRRRVLFFDKDEGQVAIAGQVVEEGRRA